MGHKYLIDTCAVIKYLDNIFPQDALLTMDTIVDNDCKLSFITKIELLVWKPEVPSDILIRKEFIKGSKIYYVNPEIVEVAIQVRKKTKIKLPDAIIAATAIVNNLILLSDNDSDFKKVKEFGLKYLNPKKDFS